MKTLMAMTVLGLALMVSGCAVPPADPAFNSTLDKVKNDFSATGANVDVYSVPISFGDLKEHGISNDFANAACITSPRPYIVVERDFWDNSSEIYREYLLAHEIGHCILGRSHDDSTMESNLVGTIAASIMNSDSNAAANWDQIYHDYYFHELVKK